MNEAKRIREHYIGPPITLIETEFHKKYKFGSQFNIEQFIWCDFLQKEYRVAIPENIDSDTSWKSHHPIETRFLTYVPTGRIVYDNTKMHAEAVAYEYIFEPLLGKTDLIAMGQR